MKALFKAIGMRWVGVGILSAGMCAAAMAQSVSSVDFGNATVGGSPVVMPVSTTTSSTAVTFSATVGTEFAVSQAACTLTGCTAQVTFTPQYPGRRKDAIVAKDSNGQVVGKVFVSGVGMAPQFGYQIGNLSVFYGFTSSPLAVTLGPDEMVYYTSTGGNTIYKAARDISSATTITLNGLQSPSGIAIDGSNTLYVADHTGNQIISYTAAGVQGTVTTSQLSGPSQIAVDGTGALYVADTGNGRIIKIDNQGVETTLASGLNAPVAVAVSSAGDVFFADSGNNGEILEIAAGTSTMTTFQSDLSAIPINLAVEASGTVFLTTDQGLKYFGSGFSTGYGATGANVSYGLALAADGDVFTTQPGKGTFSITDRQSSNFILSAPPRVMTSGGLGITNTGNMPLTFSSFSTTGPEFTVDPASQCTPNGVLQPATQCSMIIDFTPPLPRRYTDTMIATSNSLNVPGTIDPFYLAANPAGVQGTYALTESASGTQSGNPVTFTASVTGNSQFTPNGTVTFLDGAAVLGTANLVASATSGLAMATLTTTSLSVGVHSITFTFPGDNDVNPGTSNAVTETVFAAPAVSSGGIDAKDFGDAPVAGPASSMMLVYAAPAGGLTFSLAAGADYALSGATCSGQCSVVVTFTPRFPGQRRDAVTAKDSGGNVFATTFLQGNGVGPQTGFTIGRETEYNTPAQQPAGIAQGPDGTIYVSDQGTKKVYPLTSGFTDGTALNFGNLGTPGALAVDGNKTVYVIDQTNDVVLKSTAAGVVSTVATSPLSSPSYLAVDGAGDLYISDTGNGRILRIDNQGNEITFLSGLNSPEGMALDAAGDFFFVDRNNGGEIQEMMPGGDPISVRQNIDPAIQAIALDAGGSYYYTAGLAVTMISTSGTGFSYTANASQPLFGLLLDQAGRYIYTSPASPLFSVHDRAVDLIGFDVPVGQTGAFIRGVGNTGNAPLVLSSLTFTGPYSLDSSNPCGVGSSIAGGAFCQVDIDFSPTAQQAYQGSLTVGANSLNTPSSNVLTLFGNGQPPLAFSTTTLAVSSHSINANQAVTLIATVADMTGVTPTGAVEFDDGATVLGQADLPPGGTPGTAIGTLSGLQLSPGTHMITAHYFGDSNVAASTSGPQTITVSPGGGSTGPGVVDSKDFGSAPVGGQPVTMNLSYGPYAGVSTITVSVRANNDFIVQSSVCGSSCNAVVSFTPLYPGVRKDVIVVRDANTGNVLATTFVYGIGTGPLFGFDVGSNSILNGIQQPSGIAVTPDNLATVIGDIGTNSVYLVQGGTTNALPIMGLGTPAGVAVDADATVFVADQTNGVIVTYNLDSQVQGSIPVQLNQPVGVAVDGAGNLYVTDAGNSRVLKIDSQLNVTTLASSVANLGPIAVDSAGNVYYAITAQPGGVVELPVAGGQPITIANNIGSIHGIAVDASGRLNYNNDAGLSIIPLFNCSVNCNLEGPGFPGLPGILNGLALNGNGDIYVTQTGSGQYAISHRAAGVQFTTAIIGNTSQTTIIVSNTGTNPLTISGLSITGSVFTLDAASQCVVGTVLIPGQICNAVIDFHPAAVQQYHEVVSFTSNSMNNSASVNNYDLYGSGTPVPLPSTTTLAFSPGNPTVGTAVTFTATVTEGTNIPPSGTVNFLDGTTVIGSSLLAYQTAGGMSTASFTTSSLSVGSHSITAVYVGDTNFSGSTSAAQVVTVGASTAVVASQNFGSVAVGQSVSMNILYTQGTNPTITTVGGQDFKVTSETCSTGCMVTIQFAPLFPGLRDDAVLVTDSTGALLAKTYVYGTGTGPQFGLNPGGVNLNSSLQAPVGVAFTQDGVAYITDAATNKVYPQVQGGTALPINGLGTPAGIAADGGHTLYVVDQTNSVVVTYSLVSGVQGVLSTTPLHNPGGVAVDGTGAVYISDNGNNRVIKVDNQGTETTLASGLNAPQGIAVDAAGDVFYADSGSGGEIVELPAGGAQATQLGTSLGTVAGIALDASGSVYYVGSFSGIRVLEPGGGTLSFAGSLSGSLTGIGINLNGDIWTTQPSTGHYEQIVRGATSFTVTSPVGTSYQQAGPQVFNTGNAPLTLSNVSLATGTVFTLDSGSGCVAGTVVAAGHACNTLVDFLPTAAQNYSDSLKFTSNNLNVAGSPNIDAEFGTGLAPALAPTTTTLSVCSSSVVFGQPLTLTATVSDAAQVTPTGVVQFVNNGNVFASVNLVASATPGTATAQGTFTTLPPGSYSIVAMYGGDSNVQASSSAAQTVTITAAPTSTILAVTSANLIQGQSEILTATVSGFLFPAMTGTVNFFDGATAIGSAAVTATNQGGTAALSVGATLTVGTHQFSAVYSGDANYLTSTSASATVTVMAAQAVATATTLTAAPVTVAYEQPITLTAVVQTSLGAAVGVGQVIFCDANAAQCNLMLNLGSAQLSAAGIAVLRLPGATIGAHNYQAIFVGTNGFAGSSSNTPTVTVTGVYPTSATITAVGTGPFDLTGTVVGLGARPFGPTGSVAFNDTSNTTTPLLGTVALGAATLGFSMTQPQGSPVSVGAGAYGIASGDFNGDGFADIAVGDYSTNRVSVLLGNGDGTFKAASSYPVGASPERVLVADFNGDGKLDLVVANTGSNTISILLGNGDGTFAAAVPYAVSSPVGLGVEDLNHDGIADIVATDYYSNTVSVLIGNGDGTFKAAVPYATGTTPQTLAEGDFNGDGNVDLAVGNFGSNTVSIFLGNGDGTFQAQVPYPVGHAPQGVQVGDFNGDGTADLVVSNSGDGTVGVLLGNGDGTFQTQVPYTVGASPVGIVVADFNGDGKADISVGNTGQASLTQSVLLGNGDGTFQAQKTYAAGNFPYGAVAADFNGDGYPDIAVTNFNDGTASILLTQVTETASATLTGVTLGGVVGTHNVGASYAGDTNFGVSTSTTMPLVIQLASQTITFPAIPAHVFGDAQFALGATASSGLPVSYAVTSGPATIVGSTVTLTGAGSVTITASQAGNASYAAAAPLSQTFVVAQASQTITFPAIPNHTTTDAPFVLNATASSGLAVAYSVVSGPATVSGGTVTVTGAGTVVIQASQAGNANYSAATAVSQSFNVALATQTITFGTIPAHVFGDAPFVLNATATSQLAVSYAVVSGPATVSGSTVTLTGAGTVVIQATQAGNATYAAATPVSQSFVVAQASQTITFPAIPNHSVGDTPFALNATASSGLVVTYSVVSGPATVAGNTVTLTGQTGTVVIQAAQTGNATYAAAPAVTQSFAVAVLTPTLTSISPAAGVIGSGATTVTLTGTNFNSGDTAQLNGTAIASTFVNATTLTAVLPGSFFASAGTGQITVFDAGVRATSGALPFVVQQTPGLVFTGPTSAGSGTQPTATLVLTNPYPFSLTGVITLSFTPSGAGASDDPAVQFAGGGRTINFTIPAQSTTTPAIQLQSGTVAGTATVTLVVTSNGVNVTPATVTPVVIRIPAAIPTITTAGLTRAGTALTVSVVGFSNTRDVATAIFHFIPADGSTVSTPDITADVTTVFANYFASPASVPYGSTFVYTQNFTLNNDASTIKSVTVTLVNSVGQSLQVSTP